MKKENKELKREREQQEADRQFKRRGNICMAIIIATFVVMLIIGRQFAGQPWLTYFFGAGGIVIAVAFFYSLRQVELRLKNGARDSE